VSKNVKVSLSNCFLFQGLLVLLAIVEVGCGATTQTSSQASSRTSGNTSTLGHEYYVSNTGSDAADGSQSQPWQTIQHAAQVVQAGDTVHVLPGTYHESPYSKNNGTAAAPIRFVSDTTWGAKITGDGATDWGFRIDGDYFTVEGFDITNVNPSGHSGVAPGGNYDTVKGNHIHNIDPSGGLDGYGGAGVIYGGADVTKGYLDVIGNVVHDVGDLNVPSYLVHGIYYGTKGGHIYNNIVFRTQGWGIELWHGASNITISNNTVFNNMQGGIMVGAGDYPCPQCGDDSTIVTNNIVVYNLAHDYGTTLIGGFGIIEAGVTGTHNVYDNNLVYGNQSGPFSLQNGNIPGPTISADPMFVNYVSDGSGDYHLRAGSPAINAGTSEGPAPTYDVDGVPRPPWDLGAYQYP
jgi:parallel beta-helix repeat protein